MPPRAREVIAPGYLGPERRTEPCADVRADCESRFDALEKWQTRQNGSLGRIEGKVDKLLFAVVTSLGALAVSLGLLVFQLLKG